MIHNEDFLNMLDLTMMMFKLRGTPETFCDILETVFLGIREDMMIGIPDTGEDTHDPVPSSVRYDDGLESLILLTNLSGEAGAVPYPLRALAEALDGSEACCGFVINPDKQNLHIPKGLIKAALGAGYQVAMDEIEKEAELMAKERRENPKAIFGKGDRGAVNEKDQSDAEDL